MRHLTPADYVTQPWANGRGQTVQIFRLDAPGGSLLFRLSVATVAEDGPFSVFPGVERNLTVISGPGFRLTGGLTLHAAPLTPVAFPGDLAVTATGVTAPSDDFNVMTARHLPLPSVRVVADATLAPPDGGSLCLFALASCHVNNHPLAPRDLLITHEKARLSGGPVIAVEVSLRL